MYKRVTITLFAVLFAFSVAYAGEVEFWTWTSGESLRLENVTMDIFRNARPDIKLNYDTKAGVRNGEAVLLAIVSGTSPDLVTTHQEWHFDFADQGAFMDLRPYIERDNFDLSIFPKELMRFYTGPNGEITGFPWQFTTMVMAYNKARFDDCGVQYPTANWTLDDMAAAARKVTVRDSMGNVEKWGLHWGVLWEFINLLWGVSFMSEDGLRCNLNHPEVIAGFKWMADLNLSAKVVHTDIIGGSATFPDWVNGKVAMTLNWPHYITAWGAQLIDEWDVEELPYGPKGYKVGRGATAGWAIPKGAKNPDEAWEVLKFLASREAQLSLLTTGRGGASLRALAEHWSRSNVDAFQFKAPGSLMNTGAIINSFNYTVIDNYPIGYAQMRSMFSRNVRRIINGEAPAEAVLNEVAQQIEVMVAEAMAAKAN
ncbi:MAG TPA: sugar ABC transporter substrate-binding protein [Firmicutes bacterium]|nr:sugar ABC transporter substrate-binding protein [Bacillota bacterium]